MDAHRAEAAAAKEGLLLARDLGIRTLILEGDAKHVIESFENNIEDLSHIGIILPKAYRLVSCFHFFIYQFVFREQQL